MLEKINMAILQSCESSFRLSGIFDLDNNNPVHPYNPMNHSSDYLLPEGQRKFMNLERWYFDKAQYIM
ncbi:MAG: hypothetical protein IH594_04465 [Bacteroidales bacterium]|nr:hypothetical protein [Bacteroidales bacterium]